MNVSSISSVNDYVNTLLTEPSKNSSSKYTFPSTFRDLEDTYRTSCAQLNSLNDYVSSFLAENSLEERIFTKRLSELKYHYYNAKDKRESFKKMISSKVNGLYRSNKETSSIGDFNEKKRELSSYLLKMKEKEGILMGRNEFRLYFLELTKQLPEYLTQKKEEFKSYVFKKIVDFYTKPKKVKNRNALFLELLKEKQSKGVVINSRELNDFLIKTSNDCEKQNFKIKSNPNFSIKDYFDLFKNYLSKDLSSFSFRRNPQNLEYILTA